MLRRKIRSALFIDFNNIVPKIAGGAFVDALPAWMAWLEDGGFDPKRRTRHFVEKRVYMSAPYERYVAKFEGAGFETIPSAADLLLALDAVESIYTGKNAQEYVVLTVDRDFAELLERLGERDKDRVVTIEKGTPSEALFPDRAEIVIPLEAFRAALQYRRPLRRWRRVLERVVKPWAALSRAWSDARSTRRRRGQKTKALVAAADHLATLAQKTPGSPVGRRTVMRYLTAQMGQSHDVGQYLGCLSYAEMIEELVDLRKDLRLVKYTDGGIAVMAPKRGDAATAPASR